MIYKTKSLTVPSDLDFFLSKTPIDKKIILVLKKKSSTEKLKYYLLPQSIFLEKINNSLIFKIDSQIVNSSIILNSFFSSISKSIKLLEKPFKKKLVLKGLGFKASVSTDLKFLELKLGYSHTIKVAIDLNSLSVKIDKNTLIVEGSDPVKVGNFSTHLRNLKYPDSYKGKGFWYKNEIINLKEVKKT
jgi:large subunit ribosomal protein L6